MSINTCGTLSPISLTLTETFALAHCVLRPSPQPVPDVSDQSLDNWGEMWFTDGNVYALSEEHKAEYVVVSQTAVIETSPMLFLP